MRLSSNPLTTTSTQRCCFDDGSYVTKVLQVAINCGVKDEANDIRDSELQSLGIVNSALRFFVKSEKRDPISLLYGLSLTC